MTQSQQEAKEAATKDGSNNASSTSTASSIIKVGDNQSKLKDVAHSGYDPAAWKHMLKLKYLPSWMVLGLLAVCAWIPNRVRDAFAFLLSFLLAPINLKFKRVIFANLHTSFPHYTEKDCQRHYRKTVIHTIITALSFGEPFFLPNFMLKRRWKITNSEVLERARSTGRPIIFCICHNLYVDRCGLFLSYSGIKMMTMPNTQRNPVFDWFINYQRLIYGGSIHTRDGGIRSLYRALTSGHSCYFLNDEDLGEHNAHFVNFFGVPKSIGNALPRMARSARAEVLAMSMRYNLKTANYDIVFNEIPDFPGDDPNKDLEHLAQVYMDEIMFAPEQYMWFLRIYKTVPDKRYFVDIYARAHTESNKNKVIDYRHRREPLLEPLPVNKDYQPLIDYEPIVAAIKTQQNKTTTDQDDASAEQH